MPCAGVQRASVRGCVCSLVRACGDGIGFASVEKKTLDRPLLWSPAVVVVGVLRC